MSDAEAKAKHDELMAATYREVEGSTAVPFALSELAFRRTKPLALEAQWRPISHIAADCYIQGLRDAADVPAGSEETMKKALLAIYDIADGSDTTNTFPHIKRIAVGAIYGKVPPHED